MKDDPVVSRARKARHEISARFGHDPKRLCEHYRKMEQKLQDRMLPTAAAERRLISRVAEERGEYE